MKHSEIILEEPCTEKNCPSPNFEMGYGMAGGGIGVYEFCQVCSKIISKHQDPEMEDVRAK